MVSYDRGHLHHALGVVDRRAFVAAPEGLNLGENVAASVEDREVFLPRDAPAQDHAAHAVFADSEEVVYGFVDLLLLCRALGLRLGVGIDFDLACEFSSLFSSPI